MACDVTTLVNLCQADGLAKLSQRDLLICLASAYGTNAGSVSGIAAYFDPNLFFTVATATPHGLVTGAVVTISGGVVAIFNGTFTITVTGPTTFTAVVPNQGLPLIGLGLVITFSLSAQQAITNAVAQGMPKLSDRDLWSAFEAAIC